MPERIKLTEKVLRDAEPVPGRDYQIFDTDVRGFAVCIYRGGGRAFTLDYRHVGRQRRMTFGRWPEWSVSAARERAKELRPRDRCRGRSLGPARGKARSPACDRSDRTLRRRASAETVCAQRGRSAVGTGEDGGTGLGPEAGAEIAPTDVDKLLTKIAEGRARPHKEKPDNRARKLQGAKPTPVRANRIGEVLRKMFTLAVQ